MNEADTDNSPFEEEDSDAIGFGAIQVEPAYRHAFETLIASGELAFGKEILWPRLIALFGYELKFDSIRWRFMCINFARMAKRNGMIITERGMAKKGVRVLLREEVVAYMRTREIRKANDSLANSLAIAAIPREGLATDVVKGLNHWEQKTMMIGMGTKNVLRRRKLPPLGIAGEPLNQVLNRGQPPQLPEGDNKS